MLFNSPGFALFLPVVFMLYWLAAGKSLKVQNILLLIASYFFYSCWDYRFLFLLIFSTALDYFTGFKMYEAGDLKRKRFWFRLSICINLGFLMVFKYYNFFAASFAEALLHLGIKVNMWTLQVILPVGISFYTFHGLSYVIDIYKNRIKPEKNCINYALFVSFFPLLVAGPIERATHLLPQLREKRSWNYPGMVDGLRQILWGLFKKMAIADTCASYVNRIFEQPGAYHGSTLIAGAVFFAFQIYCDFSGYSDIAIGTARLFGIELYRNFAFPYFSRDIAEFWRRWHISLATWFRDYLYIPLGGSKVNPWRKTMNIFIIFLVSGFWHGANLTFIAWGALNAVYMLPLVLTNTHRSHRDIAAQGKYFPAAKELLSICVTFCLATFGWIFFRADSLHSAFRYIRGMFSLSVFSKPEDIPVKLVTLLIAFVMVEWLGREQPYAIARTGLTWPVAARWGFYYLIIAITFELYHAEQPFIYFQF